MSAESPATPIHTYSTGTLVYEVNLSVPREKAEEYIEWLRGFTKACSQDLSTQFSILTSEQVQRIPGFLSSMVFRQPKPYGLHWLSEEGNNKTYITVHYVIESQDALKSYLENDQPKVAAAEQERFEFLVTSRRTLSVVF
ncbi:hypothetical protein BGX21_000115 [Mortierella sp. AD011]|nr:hypothetical protein BGX20_005472 [Mortierella sp. AD010]KAF9389323.1 hypothetical protein BGX21_000115 [Mortierella sp. AD011]